MPVDLIRIYLYIIHLFKDIIVIKKIRDATQKEESGYKGSEEQRKIGLKEKFRLQTQKPSPENYT